MILSKTILARIEKSTIEKIEKRESWPVATLAKEIGCSRTAIYSLKSPLDPPIQGAFCTKL